MQLSEQLHIFTAQPLEIEKRKRAHFNGTTTGLTIVDVPTTLLDSRWRLTAEQKQELFGPLGKLLGLFWSVPV